MLTGDIEMLTLGIVSSAGAVDWPTEVARKIAVDLVSVVGCSGVLSAVRVRLELYSQGCIDDVACDDWRFSSEVVVETVVE